MHDAIMTLCFGTDPCPNLSKFHEDAMSQKKHCPQRAKETLGRGKKKSFGIQSLTEKLCKLPPGLDP